MNESESQTPSRSIGKTVIAGLILLLVAVFLVKIVIGIALALFVPVIVILAVIALIWAYRVLF
jgi:preprotein translocase subunit SecF